jgi:excisionase family DNA binding protein
MDTSDSAFSSIYRVHSIFFYSRGYWLFLVFTIPLGSGLLHQTLIWATVSGLAATSNYSSQKTLMGSVQVFDTQTKTTEFEPLLTVDDAVKLIPVHKNTLLRWARRGKVSSIAVGRRVFFRASDLERWVRTCYDQPAVHAAQPERATA